MTTEEKLKEAEVIPLYIVDLNIMTIGNMEDLTNYYDSLYDNKVLQYN